MKTSMLLSMAALAAIVLFAGCRSPNPSPRFADFEPRPLRLSATNTFKMTNQLDSALFRAPTNLFTLGPGDKLEVELTGETNSLTTTVVGPDGKVYFNLLPGLDVWGLTLSQTKTLMEHELARYFRDSPRVNVTLREVGSKRVWLLGRFQAPGVYNMTGPMTVLEAISMAGGSLTYAGAQQITGGPISEDLADLRRSFIIRNGKMLPIDFKRLLTEGDLTQNVYLQPDDFVYFSPAYTREVYVLGAVLQPKAVPYGDGLTLAGAIAGSFGTVRDAYLSHVAVVRGSLTEPQFAVVDYKAIVHGKEPDIALEPHDIVYVPWSPYRYLRKYAEIALDTFVSSVAINAGTRAVLGEGSSGPAGVFIPVGSGIQVSPPVAPPIQ